MALMQQWSKVNSIAKPDPVNNGSTVTVQAAVSLWWEVVALATFVKCDASARQDCPRTHNTSFQVLALIQFPQKLKGHFSGRCDQFNGSYDGDYRRQTNLRYMGS